MHYKFLNQLDLSRLDARRSPSVMLEDALNDWARMRGSELGSPDGPSYEYYLRDFVGNSASAWRMHDNFFDIEEARRDYPEYLSADDYEAQCFAAVDDYPARALGVIGREMGWRLIPYAKWVGLQVGDAALAHYVERHCREWAGQADVVFSLLCRMKTSPENSATLRAMLDPIRERADIILRKSWQALGERYFH